MQKRILQILGLLALAFLSTGAQAHNPNETYLYIDAIQGDFGGDVQMNLPDAGAIFDLDSDGDGTITKEEIKAGQPKIWQTLSDRMTFEINGERPTISFQETTYLGSEDTPYAQFNFKLDYSGPVPDTILLTFDSVFDQILDGHRAFALVRSNSRTGLENNEGYIAYIFNSGIDTAELNLLGDPPLTVFLRFVVEGIEHILIGFDHVAFLMALLLPSVLIASAGVWLPAASLREAGWSIFKIATAFTLAHSITLTVSALGVFVPASAPIEIAIALSIVFAALLNIFTIRPALALPVVFLLGLLHGFGFSFVLEPLGVARTTLVQSLLGFNIGVELGQLLIITVVFPVLFLVRRQEFYVPFILRGGSGLLILIAVYWFGERAIGYVSRL